MRMMPSVACRQLLLFVFSICLVFVAGAGIDDGEKELKKQEGQLAPPGVSVPSSSTDAQGTKIEDNKHAEGYYGAVEDFVADFVPGVDADTDGIVTHEEGQEQEEVDKDSRLLKMKKSKSTKKLRRL
jgi:hypothetical protein